MPLTFFWWAHKFCLFLQEWRFSRSGPSKVIDVGTNRKRVCDFLLVRNSNRCPILHRFGGFASFLCSLLRPYSTLILAVFPLHQIAHVAVIVSRYTKLFGLFVCEIIFEVFQGIVISLSTVEYTSVSRVYSTVDSDITNLIHGPCKLSGASSGFDGWLYVPSQAWRR